MNNNEKNILSARGIGKTVKSGDSDLVILREIELSVMKQDDYVFVLNNPVYFSGSSVVHIMKKTGRFYWSEFAYSEILKADEGHVRVGRFSLKSK